MPLFRFRDSLSGPSKFLRRGCFEPRRPLEKVEKRQRREAAARLLELDPAFTISAPIIRGGQSNTKLLTDGLYLQSRSPEWADDSGAGDHSAASSFTPSTWIDPMLKQLTADFLFISCLSLRLMWVTPIRSAMDGSMINCSPSILSASRLPSLVNQTNPCLDLTCPRRQRMWI